MNARRPTRLLRHLTRFRLRTLLACLLVYLVVMSILWAVVTWEEPGRLIFLPFGDVGLGFHSHAGWLSWIEYADWMAPPDGDTTIFSVPWFIVICLEIYGVLYLGFQLYRRDPFYRWWGRLLNNHREGTCAGCGRHYMRAGPFVEGYKGVLVCGRCLQGLVAQQPVPIVPKSIAQGTDEKRDEIDPYVSPKAVLGGPTLCSLCGCEVSANMPMHQLTGGLLVCAYCVPRAIELIEAEVNKKQHS